MKKKTSKNKKSREVAPADVGTANFKKVKKVGRRSNVDYEQFVKIWISSASVSQVAEELGIEKTTASAIAGRIRRAGVDLKKFDRRVKQPINVKKLNRIARGKGA